MGVGSVVTLPPSLAVRADFELTALNVAQADKALKLILFILSPAPSRSSPGTDSQRRHASFPDPR